MRLRLIIIPIFTLFISSCYKTEEFTNEINPCRGEIKLIEDAVWEVPYEINNQVLDYTQLQEGKYFVFPYFTNNAELVIIDTDNGDQRKIPVSEQFSERNLILNNGKLLFRESAGIKIITLDNNEEKYVPIPDLQDHSQKFFNINNNIYLVQIFQKSIKLLLLDDQELKFREITKYESPDNIDAWNTLFEFYINEKGDFCVVLFEINTLHTISYNITKNIIEYEVSYPNSLLSEVYFFNFNIPKNKYNRFYLNTYTFPYNQCIVFDFITGKEVHREKGVVIPMGTNHSVVYRSLYAEDVKNRLIENKSFNTVIPFPYTRSNVALFIHNNKHLITTYFGEEFNFVDINSGCNTHMIRAGFGSQLFLLEKTNEVLLLDSKNRSMKKFKLCL